MQDHSEKEMVDLFVEIERTLPVDTYEINGVKVWPYIRLSIKNKIDSYFLVNGGNQGKPRLPLPFSKRLKQVLNTFGRAMSLSFDALVYFPYKFFFSSEKIDLLMFCFNSPFLRTTDRGINRNLVGMIDTLEQQSRVKYKIIEYTAMQDMETHSDFPGFNISRVSAALNEWCRFQIACSEFGRKTELDFVEKINAILVEKNVPVKLESYKLVHEVNRIIRLSKWLGTFLVRHDVKKVVNVCYYGYVGMAVNLACYREGRQCIEYQHGVQTDYHPLYSNWRNVPKQGYELIPDSFWVWGNATYDVIHDWVKDQHFHQVEVVGNAWLDYFQKVEAPKVAFTEEKRQQYTGKKLILISLQAFPEHYRAHVTAAIAAFDGNYVWVLKEHPRYLLSDEQLEAEFGNFIRAGKVLLERQFSLYEMLTLLPIHAHLTAYSTVAFECEYYGIPTLFFHKNGVNGNARLIDKAPHLYEALDAESLMLNLTKALDTRVEQRIFMDKTVVVADKLLKGL